MQIAITPIENGILATISGRMDDIAAIDAQKKLLEVLRQGPGCLIIDLHQIDYLSSTGLRTLLIIGKRSQELSIFSCLIHASDAVKERLNSVYFPSIINLYDNLETALQCAHKKSNV